jgi:hypothetical protein
MLRKDTPSAQLDPKQDVDVAQVAVDHQGMH